MCDYQGKSQKKIYTVSCILLLTVKTQLILCLAVQRKYGLECELIFPRKGDDYTERTVLSLIDSMHAYRTQVLDQLIHSLCL